MGVIYFILCVALALFVGGTLGHLAMPELPHGPILWIIALVALALATWLMHDEPQP